MSHTTPATAAEFFVNIDALASAPIAADDFPTYVPTLIVYNIRTVYENLTVAHGISATTGDNAVSAFLTTDTGRKYRRVQLWADRVTI